MGQAKHVLPCTGSMSVWPSSSATFNFSILREIFRSCKLLETVPSPKAPVRVFGRFEASISVSIAASDAPFDFVFVGAVPPRARSLKPLNIYKRS